MQQQQQYTLCIYIEIATKPQLNHVEFDRKKRCCFFLSHRLTSFFLWPKLLLCFLSSLCCLVDVFQHNSSIFSDLIKFRTKEDCITQPRVRYYKCCTLEKSWRINVYLCHIFFSLYYNAEFKCNNVPSTIYEHAKAKKKWNDFLNEKYEQQHNAKDVQCRIHTCDCKQNIQHTIQRSIQRNRLCKCKWAVAVRRWRQRIHNNKRQTAPELLNWRHTEEERKM